MSGVKHTPGPWESVGNNWENSTVYGPDGEVIATCQIHHDVTEETQDDLELVKEANARLIATVPDFFDHAKSLVEAWDARTTGAQQIITGKSDRELQKQAMEAIDGLRAAIARARGEQDGGGE